MAAQAPQTPPYDLVKLREIIARAHFTDLRLFCADLGEDYNAIVGEGKTVRDAALALVKFFDNRGRVAELVTRVRREFPSAEWDAVGRSGDVLNLDVTQEPDTLIARVEVARVPGPLRVFICHSSPDKAIARKLYVQLKAIGVQPWLDEEDLIVGQDWRREIRRAVEKSDVVLVCISRQSISRDGFLSEEINYVLIEAERKPKEINFILPLRLDDCTVPERLLHLHWLDWFDVQALEKLIRALQLHATNLRAPLLKFEPASNISKSSDIWQSLMRIRDALFVVAKSETPTVVDDLSRTTQQLNAAKAIIVGQSDTGKTALVERLFNNRFSDQKSKTEGIDISNWMVHTPIGNIDLSVWDFGGQEILHSTHQFFLTKRSLYIIVLSALQDEFQNRLDYWLKIIRSFADQSPIILAINKIDLHHLDVDEKSLRQKYPEIIGILHCSCKSGQGFDLLSQLIAEQLAKLPNVKDHVPIRWMNVKNRLRRSNAYYLQFLEYSAICESEQIVSHDEQRQLLDLLHHDLGVMLNFGDDPRLRDTNVLKPEWITTGIYKILNSALVARNLGTLTIDSLSISE